jgi:hypothetical protein
MGAGLFHADREKDKRIDRKKSIVALLNYIKTPKKKKRKLRTRQAEFSSLK